jgi:hypothetical protein
MSFQGSDGSDGRFSGIVTLTVLIHGKALETAFVTPWQRSIPPSPRAGRGGELAG